MKAALYQCQQCHHETNTPITELAGNQIGAYCPSCGHWIKWVSQKDVDAIDRIVRHMERPNENG